MKRQVALAAVLICGCLVGCPTLAEEWRAYADTGEHYRVDLPVTSFEVAAESAPPSHLTLRERDGDATIDIYTGVNAKHLSQQALQTRWLRLGRSRTSPIARQGEPGLSSRDTMPVARRP